MQQQIDHLLRTIQLSNEVRILLAVESGSRAWGFPSTDSDFDVRFLYVHKPEWYLSLDEGRDVIEHTSDDELLDLNGWELRKAFRLLLKGNAAVYEWLQSPIIYSADGDFLQRTWALAPAYFPLKAGLYHYLGLVKGVLEDLAAPEIKVKRSFYGLRAALAARWIVEKRSVPPMTFDELKAPLERAPSLLQLVESLRREKAHQTESFRIAPPDQLIAFLDDIVHDGTEAFESLPNPTQERSSLNTLFGSLVLGGAA